LRVLRAMRGRRGGCRRRRVGWRGFAAASGRLHVAVTRSACMPDKRVARRPPAGALGSGLLSTAGMPLSMAAIEQLATTQRRSGSRKIIVQDGLNDVAKSIWVWFSQRRLCCAGKSGRVCGIAGWPAGSAHRGGWRRRSTARRMPPSVW
jgi:hypothetical protein